MHKYNATPYIVTLRHQFKQSDISTATHEIMNMKY